MMHRCMGCMNEYDANLSVCPHCNYAKNSNAKEPHCLTPETVLDKRYIVGRVVNSDAFAIKYLAWDFAQECSVIIKEYFPKELSSRMPGQTELNSYDGEKARQFEAGLKAFVEEGSNLAEISEGLDGIAKVKSIFVENSTAYIVTENFDGVSFKEVLEMGRLPWQDAISLMQPLMESLEVIHQHGLINYDVEPDNIVMTRDRKMKLLDFGGSRFATVGNNKNLDLITTDGFSALELYRDDADTTAACDVYSVAAILYYAITGVVPASAMDRNSSDKLKSPSQLGIEISQNAENALMNALNVNVAYRTTGCGEFLSQLYSSTPVRRVVERKKLTDTGKLSKKAKIALCLVALIVAGAIAGIFALKISPKNEGSEIAAVVEDFIKEDFTLKQAKDWAKKINKEKGCNIKIVDVGQMKISDKNKAGKIVDQDPKAKFEITVSDANKEDGYEIRVKIGKYDKNADANKNKKVEMPDLIGKTPEEAKALLEKKGFIQDPVNEGEAVYSETVPSGCICAQSVEAGSETTLGTGITYTLSKGPEPTTTAAPTTEAAPENNNDYTPDYGNDSGNDSGNSGGDNDHVVDTPIVEEPVIEEPVVEEPEADFDPGFDAGADTDIPPAGDSPVVDEPIVEVPVIEGEQ